ncbi:DUF2283 domain-containing protein [Patescibacteria group bacterium]|nr:DUF2283 domain-containing protein [Patescibacteria group bacterium]
MKVHYDKDEDILMIVLTNKKIDDSYETKEGNIVSVAEDREPVMIDIFKASKFLKDLGKAIPGKVQREIWPEATSVSVAHRIK